MGRLLASLGIALLLLLDLGLPRLPGLGRRGSEAKARADVASLAVKVGERLPALSLLGLDGRPLSMDDFLGHRVLLTFERSVDW